MRNKIAGSLFWYFFFLLAVCTTAQAEPVAATDSNAELEEVIEYEEPEGLVNLEPKFEWSGEDRFLLSFRVANDTNVLIPETEVVLQLSGTEEDTESVSFDGSIRAEPENYPGTALFSDGQKVLRVLLTDISPGSEYVFYTEGTAGEAASVPVVQAALILRGYGLEHSTESEVEVPDRVVEEEPVEEITVLLSVRLLENGKTAVSAPFAYLPEQYSEIYTDNDKEYAKRRMHFLPYTQEEGSRSIPLPTLAFSALAVMMAVYSVLNHILVKRAIIRIEKENSGRALLNIRKMMD